ncbi:MAG: hypothetical protein ATN35_06605 [Epulopiscium sp. Nele67-Bin004]|nr:MAG: hypothetical protein ATN35_06605 [Epulopiscium sp. Nele67-Bin004]
MKLKMAGLVIACMTLFVGCNSSQSVTAEQITEFVQANIDSDYLREHTAIQELTTQSIEHIDELYMQGIRYDVEKYINYTGIGNITAEQVDILLETFVEINKKAKYTIEQTTEISDDLFRLVVEVEPMNIIKIVTDDRDARFADFGIQTAGMSDIEFNMLWNELMVEILVDNVDKIGYYEPVEVIIEVFYNEETGYYVISDEYYDIYDNIIKYDF